MRRSNLSKIESKKQRDLCYSIISQKIARTESERKNLGIYLKHLSKHIESHGAYQIPERETKSEVVTRLHKNFKVKYFCGTDYQFQFTDRNKSENSILISFAHDDATRFQQGLEVLKNACFKEGRNKRLFNRFTELHAPKIMTLDDKFRIQICSFAEGATLQDVIKFEREHPLAEDLKIKTAAMMLATLLRLYNLLDAQEPSLVLTGLKSSNIYLSHNGLLQFADFKNIALIEQSDLREVSAFQLALCLYEYLQNKTLDEMLRSHEVLLSEGLPYPEFNPDFSKLPILQGAGQLKETLRTVLTDLKDPYTLNMAFELNFRDLSQRLHGALKAENLCNDRCDKLEDAEFLESLMFTESNLSQRFVPETQRRAARNMILSQNDQPAEIIRDIMPEETSISLERGEIPLETVKGAHQIAIREYHGLFEKPEDEKIAEMTPAYPMQQKNYQEIFDKHYKVKVWYVPGERHRYSGERH